MVIKITITERDMSPDQSGIEQDLASMLAERLSAMDLSRALEEVLNVDDLVSRMFEAVPDAFITEPLIGSCYTTAALARWKQVTRQAITRQREIGVLFAVQHKALFYFPSVQFDNYGRQTQAFSDLWADYAATGGPPLAFAVWLETPDPATGLSPAIQLRNTPDGRTPEQRLLDGFTPTIVDPPNGAAATEPDTKR
jgi:hypothetical protein